MAEINFEATRGWQICRSITNELDLAIHFYLRNRTQSKPFSEFSELFDAIPGEWEQELLDIIAPTSQRNPSLEIPAYLTGVLFEEDYSRATLPIRELSVARAIELMADMANKYGLATFAELDEAARFKELILALFLAPYQQLKVPIQADFLKYARTEIDSLLNILQGQPGHDRYWHWVDRFYYEIYRPWRETRIAWMDSLEQQAVVSLGAAQSDDRIPDMAWLPGQNPIMYSSEIHEAVLAGKLRTYFQSEPFGIADSWSLLPFGVVVSFARPGQMYHDFHKTAEDLAKRAQALADPTRLIILRLIRYFGMTNTDMAQFLNLARPTVSIHAKVLREAGLIRTDAEGRTAHHEIQPGEIRRLFRDLELFLDPPQEE